MADIKEKLTEAWTQKPLYTFNSLRTICNDALANANRLQTYEAITEAFARVKEYLMAICLKRELLNQQKKELNEIEICLYGDPNNIKTTTLWQKYHISISVGEFGEKVIYNGLNIVNALYKIFQEISEEAYNNNLIIPLPFEKKSPVERLEEVLVGS